VQDHSPVTVARNRVGITPTSLSSAIADDSTHPCDSGEHRVRARGRSTCCRDARTTCHAGFEGVGRRAKVIGHVRPSRHTSVGHGRAPRRIPCPSNRPCARGAPAAGSPRSPLRSRPPPPLDSAPRRMPHKAATRRARTRSRRSCWCTARGPTPPAGRPSSSACRATATPSTRRRTLFVAFRKTPRTSPRSPGRSSSSATPTAARSSPTRQPATPTSRRSSTSTRSLPMTAKRCCSSSRPNPARPSPPTRRPSSTWCRSPTVAAMSTRTSRRRSSGPRSPAISPPGRPPSWHPANGRSRPAPPRRNPRSRRGRRSRRGTSSVRMTW
jgi:hypothetical protein